ncbi:SusC/RagA family TonB-linked outer membrane protein [Niabella sp.]|uniref:SusC/RagA family TonB-linked outer membrane protein n=1 Tax=Niabella sp. TaxID=1962976 RepID=UPI002618AC47|nr:SusC/RagA family TonB-linked outer membrane protein [Niabella sp.]
MRKIVLLFAVLAGLLCTASAQTKTITGRVIDEAGKGVPFATVLEKGTSNGVSADENGNFRISLKNGSKLEITANGFDKQEVTAMGGNPLTITLKLLEGMQESVVVTALGISRERKTLSYNPQVIKSDQLEDRGGTNLLSLLQGKVAGADIAGSSGAAGASVNIILRGMTSISNNNQALFVVDGVPISNDVDQTGSTLYGIQPSNRAYDLNPNNIESVSILAGPAAAVLYGSRAASGAVIITTKKGSGIKNKVNVTASTSYSQQKVYGFPKLQNEYGQGASGIFSGTSTNSWGPKFGSTPTLTNGLIASVDQVVNGVAYKAGDVIPYNPYPDNLIGFFETGNVLENNLSINGGDDKSYFGIALNNSTTNGILPGTSFKRNSIEFNAGSQLTTKLNVSGSAKVMNTLQEGTTQGNGGNSAMFRLFSVTRSTNLDYYKQNYQNPDGSNNWFIAGNDNPYWAAYNNPLRSNLMRFIGNVKVAYDVFPWLNVAYRVGADYYTDRRKKVSAIGSTAGSGLGQVLEDVFWRSELNGDLLVNLKKNDLWGTGINANFLLGQNINQRVYQNPYISSASLAIPGFYNVSNGSNFNGTGEYSSKRRLVGHFGQLSLGYKGYLNTEFTLRADQSSTLPKANNTYIYYSAGGSFVATEAFRELKSDILNFAKLRLNYAQVGNDAPVYSLTNSFSSQSFGNNTGSFSFPFGSLTGFGASGTLPNADLKPEITKSFELGANLGLLKDRVTLDFTAYWSSSINQIMSISIPSASGYTSRYLNAGKITNAGTEISLGITPVKNSNVVWSMNFTFSKNKNMVKELFGDIKTARVSGSVFGGVIPSARIGYPYGVIVGSKIPRSPDGQFLIDSTTGNFAVALTDQVVADPNRKWIGGWVNTVSYKGFTLSTTVDLKYGGDIMSWTVATLRSNGSLYETGIDRDTPKILPGVIQRADGTYIQNYIQIPTQTYWNSNFGGIGGSEFTVFDATTFRIREASLGYSFAALNVKSKFVQGLKLTVFARNLFFYAPNSPIDPELSTQGAGNIRGLELQSAPNTRSFGANLKITL